MGGGARGAGVVLWVLLATELVLQPQCAVAMAGARGGPGAAAAAARQLLQIPLLPCLTGLAALQIPGFLSALKGLLSEAGSQYGTCVAPPLVDTAVTPPGDPAACCSQAKAEFVEEFPPACYNILCPFYKNPILLKQEFGSVDPRVVDCFARDACP